VDTGVSHTGAFGGAGEVEQNDSDQRQMTQIANKHRRTAFCECGAHLAGDSEQELFDSVQQHLAHHHPQLLGAVELEMVHQMAEDAGGH